MQNLLRSTLDALEAVADPRRAALTHAERPTAERLLGLPVPVYRDIARQLARQTAAWPVSQAVALALDLRGAGVHEARQVAYELLATRRGVGRALDRAHLEALGAGMDNWASVDTLCTLLAGDALREGRLTEADLLGWAASPDRWWRRAALVSTTGWNQRSRGGRGETAGTLRICAALIADRDDMVVKALSWALRALAVRDPEAVLGFLDAHADAIPARARREVRTKLETGTKSGRTTRGT